MEQNRRAIRPRNLRKIITRMVVFLLLGAIVNVAVAWGFALGCDVKDHDDWRGYAGFLRDTHYSVWHFDRWSRVGVTYVEHCFRENVFDYKGEQFDILEGNTPEEVIPAWSKIPYSPGALRGRNLREQHRLFSGFGWPCLSMWLEYVNDPEATRYGRMFDPIDVQGAIELQAVNEARRYRYPVALPLRTIWPGFAINTIFYAAILWLLFAAPFVVRRWRRIKRGLCPVCAYPIGMSDVCTECGKPVRLPRPRVQV